jgi:tetratricopeptide (TPR) repeat protein
LWTVNPMLTGRNPRHKARQKSPGLPRILMLAALAGGVFQGCSNKTSRPDSSPTRTATVIPAPASISITDVPAPPELPEPHPTREEMKQMRLALDASSPLAPEEVLRLAEAVGDLDRVESEVRGLQRHARGDIALRYRLANILHRQLKVNEARQAYLALHRDDPKNVAPYLALADLENVQGHKTAAWGYLEKGVTANRTGKENVPNLIRLARRYFTWRDAKGAERVLRQALEISPDDPQVLLPLATLCHDTKRAAESRKILTSVLQKEPGNLDAKRQLASVIAEALAGPEDVALAGRLLTDILQNDQFLPDDYQAAGRLAEKDQKWDAAAQSYVKALTLDPEKVAIRYRLVQVYKQLGQAAYARQETAVYASQRAEQERRAQLDEARSAEPLSAAARFAEAQFAEKTQDYPTAVIAYGLAARLAPKDTRIRQARDRFYASLGWPPVFK